MSSEPHPAGTSCHVANARATSAIRRAELESILERCYPRHALPTLCGAPAGGGQSDCPCEQPDSPDASASTASQVGAPVSSSPEPHPFPAAVPAVSFTCGAGSSASGGPIQRTTSPSP